MNGGFWANLAFNGWHWNDGFAPKHVDRGRAIIYLAAKELAQRFEGLKGATLRWKLTCLSLLILAETVSKI